MGGKARLKREPKHIRLYASITGSDAWKHLSGNAIKVLIALVARDDGTRNGNIGFSCREAGEAANVSPHTANRCLQELVDHGFIRCTQKGAFSRKISHASLWRYTWAAWPEGKLGPTRDFEKWKHDENSRCQNLHATVSVSALEVETPADAVAEIDTDDMETPHVSVDRPNAEIDTLIIYQREASSVSETDQRKQANPPSWALSAFPSDDIADLRRLTTEHLAGDDAGSQSRLAERIGCPAGTFSKFMNGRNLPDEYRAPLADAIREIAA